MEPRRTSEVIENALPFVILLTLIFLAYNTLEPFLPGLVWGLILAVALEPFHRRIEKALGYRRRLASLVLALILCIVLVVPMLGLSQALIAFLPEMLQWGSEGAAVLLPEEGALAPETADSEGERLWDVLLADINFIREHFRDEIKPVAFWLIGEARLMGVFVFEFLIGIILATIMVHQAPQLSSTFLIVSKKAAGPIAWQISSGAVNTIRSTVFGVLGSAMVQTALASVSYWYVAAPHWPVLSLLTFLLAMIQIGPFLVSVPLAVWLWSGGDTTTAIIFAFWNLVVVGLSDNLVRVFAVSRGAEMPSALAFLGALGGLLTWGIVGLFLGPVVIAVCYQILLLWLRREDGQITIPTESDR